MSVKRRSTPRLLVVLLAVPIFAVAYVAFFSRRAVLVGRSTIAVLMGAGVIGSVYAEIAARQATAPVRRAPLPITLATGLAVMLVASGLPAATTFAAQDQAEAVVQAALKYRGSPYVWGAVGPNTFDCSGLVYRAFKDAGEAPLISGRRLTALGYFKYFAVRGLSSQTDGKRGDLVIYGGGKHIGIYLGEGKVLSALSEGVTVHGLKALHNAFTAFLHIDWTAQPMTNNEFINNVPDSGSNGQGGGDATTETSTDNSGPTRSADAIATGFAFGSLNVRSDHSPAASILGWVSRGTTVEILAADRSPSGALWYKVRKANGKQGWIWSHWIRVVSGSVGG